MVMGVSTAHAIAPHLLKLGYDSDKDLVPVVFVGAVPNVLVVNNSLPVDSVQSLVKLAKEKPGQLNYATSGSGSTSRPNCSRTRPACSSRTFLIAAVAPR